MFIMQVPPYNDDASIDGAEQLWVKDLTQGPYTVRYQRRIEPDYSNQSDTMTQLL